MADSGVAITDLLNKELVDNLAIPSNIRRGRAIFERGGVEIIEQTDTMIDAWAGGLDGPGIEGGSQRRRLQLFINDENKLAWHCAGNPKNHQIFCKHCVAVSLYVMNT